MHFNLLRISFYLRKMQLDEAFCFIGDLPLA